LIAAAHQLQPCLNIQISRAQYAFPEGMVMANGNGTQSLRAFSIVAIVFGILGITFCWWVPLGMVLSLAGFMLGAIDWLLARRHSLDFRMSVLAMLLAVSAFALNVVIVALGWQLVTFTSLR
jgi:hypothetical protein